MKKKYIEKQFGRGGGVKLTPSSFTPNLMPDMNGQTRTDRRDMYLSSGGTSQKPGHGINVSPVHNEDNAIINTGLKRWVVVQTVCSVLTAVVNVVFVVYAVNAGVKTSAVAKQYYSVAMSGISDRGTPNEHAMLTPERVNNATRTVYGILDNINTVSLQTVPITAHVGSVLDEVGDRKMADGIAYVSQSAAQISPETWGQLLRNLTQTVAQIGMYDFDAAGELTKQVSDMNIEQDVGARVDKIVAKVDDIMSSVHLFVRTSALVGQTMATTPPTPATPPGE